MRWTVGSCQDATSIIASHLNYQGANILNYVDDFGGGVASSRAEAKSHFDCLQDMLDRVRLVDSKHKESPHSQQMT